MAHKWPFGGAARSRKQKSCRATVRLSSNLHDILMLQVKSTAIAYVIKGIINITI